MHVDLLKWRTSSFSGANGASCVEVAPLPGSAWRKSSFSPDNGNSCVEVAPLPERGVAVRDTKDFGRGPVLRFAEGEWAAFVKGVDAGEFD